MRILIDVNLSPAWVEFFGARGLESIHWTTVNDPRASDEEILRYALDHGLIVFTHDLDFGTLLALTRAVGPSVVQVRTQDILPSAIGELVVRTLEAHRDPVEAGALLTIDPATARVRILPIR